MSLQEKAVDLMLFYRSGKTRSAATFQVKASRFYIPEKPKKSTTSRFNYYLWFNTFKVSKEADFYCLFGFVPNTEKTGASKFAAWDEVIMLFTFDEMSLFLSNIKKKGGGPDKMFSFGFDNVPPNHFLLVRGAQGKQIDYSDKNMDARIVVIKDFLGGG